MATTAVLQLNSTLMTGALSATATTTCMKAGTTADDLDQMRMGYNKVPTGTIQVSPELSFGPYYDTYNIRPKGVIVKGFVVKRMSRV